MQLIKNKPLRIIFRIVFTFVFIVITLISSLILAVYLEAFDSLPDKTEISAISNEEASLVFSSDSILIGKYFAENRTNIELNEIPDHLIDALIATEDKRFYTHEGFDTKSYFRVFFKSILLQDKSGGGGSTLTQQLVKNLYKRKDHKFLSLPKNKIKEIIIASRFEDVYSKEELLLLYLNSVPFGEDVYGVESAAHRYFNKSTKELKIEESAVLVGMLKANTYYNPKLNPENSFQRRNLVLKLMEKTEYLDAETIDSLQKLPLILDYENIKLNVPAGYFVYQVKKKTLELLDAVKRKTGKAYNPEKDGLKIYTTLDYQVQELSDQSAKKHLAVMQKLLDKELQGHGYKKQWYRNLNAENKDTIKSEVQVFDRDGVQTKNISKTDSLWHYYKMLNASVFIVNPKNGAVLTWVGGNHFRMLPFDMVLSHRQAASVFKPILYATALEESFSPCTYLENIEKEYSEYEAWMPQNANHKSTPDSSIALWYALAQSMNLPTVDLYFKVGREKLINTCNKLKFPTLDDDAPSIALGTIDLSLYEIVRAFSSFSNNGKMNEPFMINRIEDTEGNILYLREAEEAVQIFEPEISQTITALLQQVIEQGTGHSIRSKFGVKSELAGKTGTAQNYSDAWFISYTPDMVIGTWVGASSHNVHFNSGKGAGSSLALPISANIIKEIEKRPDLKEKYLTQFDLPEEIYSFLQCNPYHQKGVKGFLKRLFKKKKDKTREKD